MTGDETELTKWFIEQVQKLGGERILFWGIVVQLGGLGVAWFIGQRGKLADIAKARKEAEGQALKNLELGHDLYRRLDTTRAELNSKRETLNLHIRDLITRLKQPRGNDFTQLLDSQREEMCNYFSTAFSPVFEKYLEEIPRLIDPSEAHARAIGDVFPALNNVLKFVQTVNNQDMLTLVPTRTPFLINKDALTSIVIKTRKLIPTRSVFHHLRLLRFRWHIRKHLRKPTW